MPDQTDEANLLIVDDLPENLLALEALLQAPNIRVHRAESAEQAPEPGSFAALPCAAARLRHVRLRHTVASLPAVHFVPPRSQNPRG